MGGLLVPVEKVNCSFHLHSLNLVLELEHSQIHIVSVFYIGIKSIMDEHKEYITTCLTLNGSWVRNWIY